MKTKRRAPLRKLQLELHWGNGYYINWLDDLEKALRKKPRALRIEIIGVGEIRADTVLLIRSALVKRSPATRLVVHARSSLQNASVLLWLIADRREIRDDARIFFRPADLPDEIEVDPARHVKLDDAKYKDSFSEFDPEEGDYARVLQIINEYLPVREYAGRLLGVAVLKQFGLIDNDRVDGFLAEAFANAENKVEVRR